MNKAFDVLAKPLERAVYLLRLGGVEIGEDQGDTDPDFLMEVMEMNEELSQEMNAEELEKVGRVGLCGRRCHFLAVTF